MRARPVVSGCGVAALAAVWVLLIAQDGSAHPLGNFSISQYAGFRIEDDAIEVRYVIDMAEIPTFQEIQEAGIVAEVGTPGVSAYLARKVEALKEGLALDLNGRPLRLEVEAQEIIFPPGADGLPTLKVGFRSRARLDDLSGSGPFRLRYRDGNFAGRAGWKEIVAVAGRGASLTYSSVPENDRSRGLADYPTDLLNSPPQDLEAQIEFSRKVEMASGATPSPEKAPDPPYRAVPAAPKEAVAAPGAGDRPAESPRGPKPPESPRAAVSPVADPLGLQANKQGTPRNTFTDLLTRRELGFGIIVLALAVSAGLGAAHALEPGHGKTVVAAYLVGSRGTAWHACVLGLVVTISHTAGVFLLGAVTLYASRYVVPERLYPWLGVLSGLLIAALGFTLFLRRYAGHAHGHAHGHHHPHGPHDHHQHGGGGHTHPHAPEVEHHHDHVHPQDHHHAHAHAHAHGHMHSHPAPGERISLSGLLALGISGGIVPCPAALVVLLSAVSLNRIGFGLVLIVAFSVGLAAVLIVVGLLMVFARRFMSRFQGEGPLITRWLPLTSAAVITLFGAGIAIQALVTAGILQIHL